jgi:hypothetical protein
MSLEPLHAALQSWQNFYILTATAAATLTGLMFVAVTFGARLVTKESATAARAFIDPIYMHFSQVLITGCLTTIPTLSRTVLGGALLVAGVLRLAGLVWVFQRYLEAHRRHGDMALSDWISSIVLPFFVHLLVLATGAGFLVDHPQALNGLALVTVSLIVLGLYGAWELVMWLALALNDGERGAPERATTAPQDRR